MRLLFIELRRQRIVRY